MSGKTFEDVLKEELAKCCDIVTPQQDSEPEKVTVQIPPQAQCKPVLLSTEMGMLTEPPQLNVANLR